MAVIPPFGPWPIVALAPFFGRGWRLILFTFEVVFAVPRGSRFAFSAEELLLKLAVLAAELFDLGFKLLNTLSGPGV
jgi:hypothetical protein